MWRHYPAKWLSFDDPSAQGLLDASAYHYALDLIFRLDAMKCLQNTSSLYDFSIDRYTDALHHTPHHLDKTDDTLTKPQITSFANSLCNCS